MGFKKKIADTIKGNSFFLGLYRFFGSFAVRILGLFSPIKKNRILFSSMSGDIYGGSPKAIYEAIREKYGDKYTYVWAFTHPEKYDDPSIVKVKIDTIRYFREASRCRIWITDVNIERGLSFKKRRQYYVNTWHGTGFKAGIPKRKDYDFRKVDLFTPDGQYLVDVFVKYFRESPDSKNILLVGRPREDELIGDVERNTLEAKQEMNLLGKKVVLYAPTFREPKQKASFSFDSRKVLDNLGEEYIILYHGHHFADGQFKLEFGERLIDATKVENINKLYLASDILVSDYSSCMVDFMLLKRPVIAYVPDYEEYRDVRGLIFDFAPSYPGGVCRNEEELVSAIKKAGLSPTIAELEEYYSHIVQRPMVPATPAVIKRMEDDGVLS